MSNEFKAKINQIRTFMPGLLKQVSGIVKVEGLAFIHDNFDAQGFINKGVVKWQARKTPAQIWRKKDVSGKRSSKLRATKAGASYLKDTQSPRAILVKRGHLRRSWDRSSKAYNMRVEFVSPLPYAQVHNEGGKAGRGKGFTMPQRQMIGPSTELDRRIKAKLDKEMNNLLK